MKNDNSKFKSERKTHVINAEGKALGRLATQIADLLRGKGKVGFAPNKDDGDFVMVENVDRVLLTGKKMKQKIYHHFTGFIGGMKETTMEKLVEKYNLCQKLCGLYDSSGACFHYSIMQCQGACTGKEPPENYNLRVEEAISRFNFDRQNFFVIDKGRHTEERSVVMVENGNYTGFGFIPHNLPPTNTLAKDFPTITIGHNLMGTMSSDWTSTSGNAFNKIIIHNFATVNPQNFNYKIGIKNSQNNFIAATELPNLQNISDTELIAVVQGQFSIGERYYATVETIQPTGTSAGVADSFSVGQNAAGRLAVAFYEMVPGAPANPALSIDAGALVVVQ